MKQRLKERLKDSIIDHIYTSGYEKVFSNEQITQESRKAWFGPQNKKFIRLYMNESRDEIEYYALHRFNSRKLNVTVEVLTKCLAELMIHGFIVENAPIHEKFGLTVKGVHHYQNGNSFEDKYLKNRLAQRAFVISMISGLIAIISFLKAFDWFSFF